MTEKYEKFSGEWFEENVHKHIAELEDFAPAIMWANPIILKLTGKYVINVFMLRVLLYGMWITAGGNEDDLPPLYGIVRRIYGEDALSFVNTCVQEEKKIITSNRQN